MEDESDYRSDAPPGEGEEAIAEAIEIPVPESDCERDGMEKPEEPLGELPGLEPDEDDAADPRSQTYPVRPRTPRDKRIYRIR